MQILVFKTTMANNSHVKKISNTLNRHPLVKEWNVDLHDCDKVLRVVSDLVSPAEIEQLVFEAGYFCEELK